MSSSNAPRPPARRALKSFSAALTNDRDTPRQQKRRGSTAGIGPSVGVGPAALTTGGAKAQRTSKTQQRLVVLPSAPQTKPLPRALSDDEGPDGGSDDVLGYETDAGAVRSAKSAGERWSKAERARRGCKRITAYSVADSLKGRALAGFLRREHNVVPRVFDEAIYAIYHLPLLPGYGPDASVRSSAPEQGHDKQASTALDAAEAAGYQGTYFAPAESDPAAPLDAQGFIASSPHTQRNLHMPPSQSGETALTDTEHMTTDVEGGNETGAETETEGVDRPRGDQDHGPPADVKRDFVEMPASSKTNQENLGEVVFFDYGVVVFFGLDAGQERAVLDDIGTAGFLSRPLSEDHWEVEECHFEHNPHVAHPRIFNDYFTLKSTSHLLKLSIAHAMAQSTLLARYEASANRTLSSPRTAAIPRQLALSGALTLRRRDALKLTGTLFALRRDVNLLGHVLDVPELFWSEASLKELYDAVREYMEIDDRVQALNEKLGVASDLLDAIHDHLNNSAMERITWIIIWLIVVACLVEMGEVVARLVVHATSEKGAIASAAAVAARATVTAEKIVPVDRAAALRVLERMAAGSTS